MNSIVAVATGADKHAGIGIVRISGDTALSIAKALFTVKGEVPTLKPNQMTLGTIIAMGMKEQAFCVYFKAPLSYTGEDVIEFHCHGGKAVLATVVSMITDLGATPAERGEFTKRAFLNQKISLDRAEGVLSMIESDSRAQLQQASRLMGGELWKSIDSIAETLLKAVANLEVTLDYPEETEEDMRKETLALLTLAESELKATAKSARLGRLVKDGARVAIVGKPNAGKSSLLNAILKEDRAIVTNVPGTTRDTLEGQIEVKGFKVIFVDTAGLRDTKDIVEKLGVERARRAAEGADIVLYLKDITDTERDDGETAFSKTVPTIVIGNKVDQATPVMQTAARQNGCDCLVSSKVGTGIVELLEKIANTLDFDSAENASIIVNERHRSAVENALSATKSAIKDYQTNTIDCIIVDIKVAYKALSEISGRDVSEAVIDRIFQTFCVGK